MLSEKENIKISKFLSLILRHKPEIIGIQLDENGWANVNELINKINLSGTPIDFQVLKHIVDTNNKKRFSFNDSYTSIRASQGHSLNIELGYQPHKPPDILYHGTALKNVNSILENGILKNDRQHVHLSTEIETAKTVGGRHGKPVVFKIVALQMHEDNFSFYLSDNNVWLTEHIPSKYLTLMQ